MTATTDPTTPLIPADVSQACSKAGPERHFRTDHLHADLKGRSIRGGAVTLAAQAIKFVLQLGSTVILARLLTPADFGLVAMVTAITGFVAMFGDFGLSAATIQRPQITQAQVSTLFWLNLGVGFVLMLLTAAAAPLVAQFYHEPRLTPIMLLLSTTFMVGALGVQHSALLKRQMRLTAVAAVDLVSIALGVCTSVLLAIHGAGYWSLVTAGPISALTTLAMVWLWSGWRPGLPKRGAGVRPMLKFGGAVSAYAATGYVGRNADNALIGWAWGPAPLGFYSKAYQLLMLPLSQVSTPLYNVVVPVLSRLQHDRNAFERYFLRVLNGILWAIAPPVAFLAACSDELVRLVLGPQWREAGILFKILAISAMFQPLYYMVPWVLISTGQSRRLLNWGMGSSGMLVLAFLAGLPWGARGVAVGYVLGFVVAGLPWTLFYGLSQTSISRRGLLLAVYAPLVVAITVFAVGVAFHQLMSPNRPLAAGLGSLLAGALAVTLILALAKPIRHELSRLLSVLCSFGGNARSRSVA